MRFLADGRQNVGAIAAMLAIRGKKSGRFVHYSLCPGVLDDAVAAGIGEQALNLGCCKLALPLGAAEC